MNSPLESTRDLPVSTTIRDCLVAAWVAAPDDQVWAINVGGHEFRGPVVDTTHHDSLAGVKEMLKQWATQHPDVFA